ncbi:MAG TPA: MBL fold metallo-hydrolase [bacterium]
MTVRFLGCGDAFGSGGRFQTCFLVRSGTARFLIDCGASSLIAMNRFGVDPAEIDLILLSHLHGDHFGGLPFFLLDAQILRKRTRPLVIAGPPGLRKRLTDAMEVLFPDSSRIRSSFPRELIELRPERPRALDGITVTPYVVEHPSGDPPFALRIECGGKIITYSGDTGWTDALVEAARGADLFIVEAYLFDKKTSLHMDLKTLTAHLGDLSARRVILTHLGADMLARASGLPYQCAEDGATVVVG